MEEAPTDIIPTTAKHSFSSNQAAIISEELHLAILAYIGPYRATINSVGHNSTVFFLQTPSGRYTIKLPRNIYSKGAVLREFYNLFRLHHYSDSSLSVCTPLTVLCGQNTLLSCIDGVDGSEAFIQCVNTETRVQLVEEFGRALQNFYRWMPTGMKYMQIEGLFQTTRAWAEKLAESKRAKLNAEAKNGLSWDKTRLGKAFNDLAGFDEAVRDDALWLDDKNQVKFVHGDFTLPNVLFRKENHKWKSVGIVDFGDCGYGDKRYDVAAAMWSIQYNCERIEDTENLSKYLDSFRNGSCTSETAQTCKPWTQLYNLYEF